METPLFDRMHKTIYKCGLSLGHWKQIIGLRWSIFGLQGLYLKKRTFSKNHMHIYCHKKRTFSQKLCSHVIFSTFFVKTLPLSCIHLVKKCQFCQNYNILWAKKSKKITLFLRFFTKKTATLIPIFVKKSSILLKPAHILLKTFILSNTQSFHSIFEIFQ